MCCKNSRLIFFFFAQLFLISCSFSVKSQSKVQLFKDTDQALNWLNQQSEKITTLSAIAKVKVVSPFEKQSFKEIIVINSLNQMRLETLNPFGQPSLIFIKNNNSVLLYDPVNNNHIVGDQVYNAIKELLGINLSVSELGATLLQDIYQGKEDYSSKYTYDTTKNRTIFTLVSGSFKKEIIFNSENLIESITSFDDSMKIYHRAVYSKYGLINELPYPYQIEIEFPQENVQVMLKIQSIAINEKIDADQFILKTPQTGFDATTSQ